MLLHEENFAANLTIDQCIAWSEDGLLAIAAESSIHILV